MAVRVSQVSPTAGRKLRRPEHPFQIVTSPWQIQPFMHGDKLTQLFRLFHPSV